MKTSSCVLVAGGAGYIGSHMVRLLREQGYLAVVVDNLCTGHAQAVAGSPLRVGSIGDMPFIRSVLREFRPSCVMHFAASSLVGESVRCPEAYWRNNLLQTLHLLDTLRAEGILRFIFSSTAAVYGQPQHLPITEDHPTRPINPYGHSKLAVEHLLQDYAGAHGLRHVVLRYFNAAGAHPAGDLGEQHEPETHLIPLVLQVASRRRPHVTRFGTRHATPDGSCVRDYIHVQDLCAAHLLALRHLEGGGESLTLNLGSGRGHSVNDVILTARAVTGHPIPVHDADPRPGDPPTLVADAALARARLAWVPQWADLSTIITHAWRWEQVLARAAPYS